MKLRLLIGVTGLAMALGAGSLLSGKLGQSSQLGTGLTGAPSAEAAGAPPSAAMGVTSYACAPKAVAVFKERIHVECTVPTSSGIRFFALGVDDPPHTARILTVLSAAQVAGRGLYIFYDPADTTNGPKIGCLSQDCRLINSATIL